MDIASAYWCVPVRSQDVEKTAFHTPRGQYEMVIISFGLCNFQATFQRQMDNALEGVERAESYVDDCCVFSTALNQHLSDLQNTFDRIRRANVRLRRDRCHFGYEQGIFFEHRPSAEGRRPV